MRRILAIVAVLFAFTFSLTVAEEFRIAIKKVEGNTITGTKMLKKGEKGDDVTLTATADVKVVKAKFNKEAKKIEAGESLAGGLKNEAVKPGAGALVITNNDGKVTEIRVFGEKKKKS